MAPRTSQTNPTPVAPAAFSAPSLDFCRKESR
jgi:hypothetical protein